MTLRSRIDWIIAWTAVVLVAVLGGPRPSDAADGAVLRANGWYAGKGDISDSQIKCEVPTVTTAIPNATFAMGLWNTYGSQTLFFPDPANPHANPCGGWLSLENEMTTGALTLQQIVLKATIPGTRAIWRFVPTRRNFPIACRTMRRHVQPIGLRLDPAGALDGHSGSGRANVVFAPVRPMISPHLIECLREQYAALGTELLASISVVVQATAIAQDDLGRRYRSNAVAYTLNLRHVCGNGRVDDGEQCDAAGDPICQLGPCKDGECRGAKGLACTTSDDCLASCIPPGSPNECLCATN